MSKVEIRNLSMRFGSTDVLRDINLRVMRGERIVICGPSGSGKSTMIRCINRLEEHQQGRIVVDGVEPMDQPADSIQFWMFDELYRKVIHRDAETLVRASTRCTGGEYDLQNQRRLTSSSPTAKSTTSRSLSSILCSALASAKGRPLISAPVRSASNSRAMRNTRSIWMRHGRCASIRRGPAASTRRTRTSR